MSQSLQPPRFAPGKYLKPTRLVMAYGLLSALLLIGSSFLLWSYVEDASLLIRIELGKTLAFIVITAILLHAFLRLQMQQASLREDELMQNLNNLPDIGVAEISIDEQRFLQFNDQLCKIFGISREDLHNKTWGELAHPEDAGLDLTEHARMLRGESAGYAAERRFVRNDGSLVFARFNVSRRRRPGAEADHLVLTLRDVTERKLHDAGIRRLSQLYATLSHCNQAIVHSGSRDELFPRVCEAAVNFGGMKMAWIGMVDEDGMVHPVSAYGDGLDYLNSLVVTANADDPHGHGPVGRAIREDTPAWIQNFLGDPLTLPWREQAASYGWRSVAALPLHLNDKTIGVYALYAEEENAFDKAAQDLLVKMSRDIEFALENFQRKEANMKMEAAMRESEDRFRDLFQNAPLPYQSMDIEGNLLEVNGAWLSMLGYRHEEVIGRFFGDFMAEKSLLQLGIEFQQFKESSKIEDVCYEVIRKDGETRLWVVNGQIARDSEGNFLRTHCIFTDITERRKVEEQLQLAAKVFEQSGEGIIMVDASGHIVTVNKAFSEITGYSAEEVLGKNPSLLSSGRHEPEFFHVMWDAIERQGRWQGEIWNRKKNGDIFPEWLSISRVLDADGRITHYIGIFSDLTAHKATEEHIHRLAHFDALTGLPNRVLLGERSRLALSMAQRHLEPLALMFIDLDHFKNINDSLGHRIGDSLLVQFAQRMNGIVREQDTLSRLGGDEFILVLPQTNLKGAAHLAEKLLDASQLPYHIDGHELGITCSIGIAMYPKDGRDFESLSQSADVAMYRAKQNGRNAYSFFAAEMQTRSVHALELENALRRAIERNQLSLHYQPQVSIVDGSLVGVEALIRWNHPKFGMVPPSDFIPVAESSGLILSIGEWVLRTAVKQMKTWLDKGYALPTVSVNISPVQFRHPHLSEIVMQTLREHGLAPRHLVLELTEGAAMENPMAAIAVMDKLHENGIRMSIDDFGIGHSSLGYLKRFRVYKLKIDRAFVHDIPNDPDDTALVGAVISLASSMGLRTIAEGVENEEQLAFLRSRGCNEIQGHYYSKALPVDLMERLLESLKSEFAEA